MKSMQIFSNVLMKRSHKSDLNFLRCSRPSNFKSHDDWTKFLFSCVDERKDNNFAWRNMMSIDKLIKSSQINIDSIIEGKHAQNGYIIISACRGNLSKEENDQRTEELEKKIRNKGYSFKRAFGNYIEENHGEVSEKSFIVFNFYRDGQKGNFEDLKNFAIELCSEYEQDSVLVKAPDGVPTYYDGNGNVVSNPKKSSNKTTVDKNASDEYSTSLRVKGDKGKKHKWTYDINFDDDDSVNSSLVKVLLRNGITHIGGVPSTINGHRIMSAHGEIVYY